MKQLCEEDAQRSGNASALTGRIDLCALSHSVHDTFLRASRPLSRGSTEYPYLDPERDCAILRLATLLMHETRHVCGRTHLFRTNCDRIERTDVVFAWAVMAQEPDRFQGCRTAFQFDERQTETLLDNFCMLDLPGTGTHTDGPFEYECS